MEENTPKVKAESGYRNIDKLPLGKLLKVKYPNELKRKKKSLVNRLKLKGPK